jgi:hypothetical protein
VELGEINPELLWLAAHLIERDETIVCIEGGVFDPLCHDRAATLLKLHHEPDMRGPLLRSEIFREAQQQNSSKEIKHGFFYRRISPPRREDGTQDDSFVVVGDNSLFGRIGAINRKQAGSRRADVSMFVVKSMMRYFQSSSSSFPSAAICC